MSGACKFCGGAELRPDLIAVGEMPGGRLYLHRDQTHPGPAPAGQPPPCEEDHRPDAGGVRRPDGQRLSGRPQALTRLYQPDKINYLVFGDTGTHLHVHIVPKYQGGKDWGKVFLTDEPSPVYLTEPEYQNSVAALLPASWLWCEKEGHLWEIF